MRRPIVAANWKMNGTTTEARRLAGAVRERLTANAAAEVVLCPTFPALPAVAEALAGSSILLGAQNLHWEEAGAFTGEVSASMLVDAGCAYVIVGHSERRTLFGETDLDVGRKTRTALAAGLRPIVCVGETLEEREAERTEQVLTRQLGEGLGEIGEGLREVVLAYEPVWAIGTGKTASTEQAQQAHAHIRSTIATLAGAAIAEAIRIQYGGSVKPSNAAELFACPDVDGGLIGGASLDSDAFDHIARAVSS